MRLIPPVNKMINPVNSNAFEELRHRQKAFQDSMIRIMSYEVTTLFSDSPNVEINLHDRLMTIKSPTFSDVPLFHCVDKPSPNAPVSLFCHPKDESYARSVTAGMVPFIRHFARQSQNFLPYSQEENAYMAKQVYRFFKMSAVKRSMGCEWCEESQGVISDTMTSALHSLTTDARFTFELKEVTGAIDGMSRAVDNKQGETVDPPSQYQTNEEDSIKTFREMTTGKKGPRSLSNTIGKTPTNLQVPGSRTKQRRTRPSMLIHSRPRRRKTLEALGQQNPLLQPRI